MIIPLRHRVSHAAAERGVADPVIVAVELTNGLIGYGETLPRPYVTGETVATVVEAVQRVFVPVLIEFHPESFADALEAIEALPWHDASGRSVPAARAAVELALLDAAMRAFNRDMDAVVQWMGLPGFGSPGSLKRIRFSGVLAEAEPRKTLRHLRLMYWGGLRHFKLKVGATGDRARLEVAATYLQRSLKAGTASLRVDANGAWSEDEALTWLSRAAHLPLASLEQPLARGDEERLTALRERCRTPFMHDESLITADDAQRLIELGVADGFNIRISKCGGLLPALRIAGLARRSRVRIQLGCMVGETSVLSAAGLRFLQVCPSVTWAEGCLGSFLLRDDVVTRGLRFGYGGRPPRLSAGGLGATVTPEKLTRLTADQAIVINL